MGDETRIRQLLQTLADVAISVDLEPTLRALLDSLRVVVPFDAGGIFVHDQPRGRIRAAVTDGYPDNLEVPQTQSIVRSVVRTGRARLVAAVSDDPDYVMVRSSTASQLAVPLTSPRGVIGAISLESDSPAAFEQEDLGLLGLFADQAAVAIERALLHEERLRRSRIDREIEVAAKILRELTPRDPTLPGFDLHGRSVVAASVGGDAFDFVEYQDGQVGLSIADPKGKGLPAALLATAHRTMLRALVSVDLRLRSVFSRMSDILERSVPVGDFVTALYGVVDVPDRRVVFVNAGHCPGLVIRLDGQTERLEPTAAALGFPQPQPVREGYVNLGPGDGIVLYTDGVTEAGPSPDLFLEIDGLETTVRASWSRSAAEICDAVLEEVERRSGDGVTDDATVVVGKFSQA